VTLQIAKIFAARWEAFHAPIASACFAFHPHQVQREFDSSVLKDVHQVMADFAKSPSCPWDVDDLTSQWSEFKEAISIKTYRLDDEVIAREPGGQPRHGAFTTKSLSMTASSWIEMFYSPWPALVWFALKVISIPSSASACEHSWSIEGWMHSKVRNRMSQKLVEKLVRAHTNMILERQFELRSLDDMVMWDVELLIDEDDGETSD
jgi:hAT family C-terminal dimerisation region